MTPDKTPTDAELQERCAEIVEWQRTGVLPGNALRNYAAKHWAGHTDALQMAERDTSALAMEQIAKWGSPVVAGPVARWEFRWLNPADNKNIAPSELEWQLVCAKGFRSVESVLHDLQQYRYHDKPVYEVRALYAATPQPTQAQAGAVPLTAKQMESGREAIFSTGNPYCPCDSKTFRKVAEWVERHHGIKEGGQHG